MAYALYAVYERLTVDDPRMGRAVIPGDEIGRVHSRRAADALARRSPRGIVRMIGGVEDNSFAPCQCAACARALSAEVV